MKYIKTKFEVYSKKVSWKKYLKKFQLIQLDEL